MNQKETETLQTNGGESSGEPGNNSMKSEVLEWVKMIVVVLVVVFVIDGIILINAKIPSASMESTIMTGDRIFGFRLAYGINIDLPFFQYHKKMKEPERFDIVIFHYPDNEKERYIKRIIGLPGEKVEIIDGKVYIDDAEEPLDDSFVKDTPLGSFGPFYVPEDSYFMLGDNRNNSKDSRFWTNKFVKFDKIIGKALFRYWPLNKMKPLHNA